MGTARWLFKAANRVVIDRCHCGADIYADQLVLNTCERCELLNRLECWGLTALLDAEIEALRKEQHID